MSNSHYANKEQLGPKSSRLVLITFSNLILRVRVELINKRCRILVEDPTQEAMEIGLEIT